MADVLQAQGKFQEAEAPLLQAHEYPRKCGAAFTPLQRHAFERVVRFYETWEQTRPEPGKSDRASE
jgi:hypothetical protein